MVKMTNHEFKIMNWRKSAWMVFAIVVAPFIIQNSNRFLAQQPQAPAGTPLYSANAKYVNGVAPGYWPTAGSGLALNVSAGSAYCGNPPTLVSYPGGTLTMTASTTNYVFLNPASNCAPAVSTSSFAAGEIPIAKVVAGASSITSVTDARTWFTPQPCATSASGALDCSAMGTNQDIALTPSGTGDTIVTNLVDKGGQVFNVKAYGAKGNDSTDDQPAFMAAWNAAVAAGGGTIYIPPPQPGKCYLINETLNFTGDKSGGILIDEAGSGFGNSPGICMNTGSNPFIDFTDTSHVFIDHLNASAKVSGLSNPSEIGIISGRDTSGWGSEYLDMDNSQIILPTHTSGSIVSYGIYFYGIELIRDYDDAITADYPLVVTASNIKNLSSSNVTWGTGGQSETGDSFLDMELDCSGLGPAVLLDGTQNMTLTGHSFNFSGSSTYPSSLYQYAFEIVNGNFSLHINWRQELFPGFAYVRESLINSVLRGNDAPGPAPPSNAAFFADASSQLTNDDFDIVDEYGSKTTNYYYSGLPNGVASMDDDYFFCGNEANCADIPVGTYQPGGWSLYQANIHYSGGPTNEHPVFKTSGSGILTRFPNSTATISFGAGAPTGSCVTPSLYLRTDGGTDSTLYVCEGGAWAAK